MNDDSGQNRRQLARKQTRTDGERSARVAHKLMDLPASSLARLELDETVREVVEHARSIVANIARRREERNVAGALRRIDLRELEKQLADLEQGAAANVRQLQLAETWRTRLIEGSDAVAELAASFPATATPAFAKLITDARRERTTGKPKGAGRALFRQIVTLLSPTE